MLSSKSFLSDRTCLFRHTRFYRKGKTIYFGCARISLFLYQQRPPYYCPESAMPPITYMRENSFFRKGKPVDCGPKAKLHPETDVFTDISALISTPLIPYSYRHRTSKTIHLPLISVFMTRTPSYKNNTRVNGWISLCLGLCAYACYTRYYLGWRPVRVLIYGSWSLSSAAPCTTSHLVLI